VQLQRERLLQTATTWQDIQSYSAPSHFHNKIQAYYNVASKVLLELLMELSINVLKKIKNLTK